jgi:hypothetical protein
MNTWFNCAFLQEWMLAMRAIKLSSLFKRVFLLAVVQARARVTERACLFLIILLLKLKASVQVYVS